MGRRNSAKHSKDGKNAAASTVGERPNDSIKKKSENSHRRSSAKGKGAVSTCPIMAASTWIPSTYTAFSALLFVRIIAAVISNISDCDEVFNYWEPTHFLLYKSGFQTWEYSPRYAIRSYAYILIHAFPGWIFTQIVQNKVLVFYLIRCLLAFCCAVCETYFYRGVCKRFGGEIGQLMLIFLLFSTGMFISCAAYLPSSFSMYLTMLAFGAWFSNHLPIAILSIGISTLLGWPFAGVLGAIIAYDTIVIKRSWFLFIKWCFITLLIIMVPLVQIDSYFFGKLVIAPLNIVLYNVFTPHGPELYGVEPWTFYFINGFLNFNFVFISAMVVGPILILQFVISKWVKKGKSSYHAEWLAILPMYIWFLIFFTQKHKEERFLFPVYPLICLSSSICFDQIEKLVSYLLAKKKPTKFYLGFVISLPFIILAVSRSLALYNGYHAPFETYLEAHRLGEEFSSKDPVNLCVGKEWYRFPSSFFLPSNWQLQFIQSEFRGQLPKSYSQHPNATSLIPDHMNDANKEETSRYIAVDECHFLIDLDVEKESQREPRYSKKINDWTVVSSAPFLHASDCSAMYRAFYIPWLTEQNCKYTNYNLLRSKSKKMK